MLQICMPPSASCCPQDSLDAQLEAVFGTSDINSGKTLGLSEFLSRLHASQLAQLTARPTMRLKGAATATVVTSGSGSAMGARTRSIPNV